MLGEHKSLRNRDLHIRSYLYGSELKNEKPDIDDKNPDVRIREPDIEDVKPDIDTLFTPKTVTYISKLKAAFGTTDIFVGPMLNGCLI